MTSNAVADRRPTMTIALLEQFVGGLAADVARDIDAVVPPAPLPARLERADDRYTTKPGFTPVSSTVPSLSGFVGGGVTAGAAYCLSSAAGQASRNLGDSLLGLSLILDTGREAARAHVASLRFLNASAAGRMIRDASAALQPGDVAGHERLRALRESVGTICAASLEMSNMATADLPTLREAREQLSRLTISA